ncbi:MAG: S41 family peptidase, partial [Thermoanaerobaculia bacterium]
GSLGRHSDLFWYGDVAVPGKQPYRGALSILIDGGCFSACEDFVAPFKDNRRATILGERTAGSSGQPFQKDFGNGMGIGLSTKREFFPDGSEFEGVGIAPDVEIPMTLEDLRTGKDTVLAQALGRIRPGGDEIARPGPIVGGARAATSAATTAGGR